MCPVPWVRSSWFETVSALRHEACHRWNLADIEPIGGLASRVFSCVDEAGRDLVLKIAPPEMTPHLEAAALRAWSGSGAPRLIAFADDLGALLMERVVPGTHLPPANDDEAIAAVADTLRRLHAPPAPASGFPTHAEFYEAWRGRVMVSHEDGTAGMRLLPAAAAAARTLDATSAQRVLLHGDFIDKNLLRGTRGYVAVDPLPHTGDACSDIGFYAAYHPPARDIAARARAFARAIGHDADRAARWAAVWAVGEATETWRADSDELQAWVTDREAAELLAGRA